MQQEPDSAKRSGKLAGLLKFANPFHTVRTIRAGVTRRIDKIKAMRMHPVDRIRVSLFTGAILMGLIFVGTLAVPLSSGPVFCGNACHTPHPREYITWGQNNHKRVTCYGCHEPPGVSEILKAKLTAGPRDIVMTITGNYEHPINGHSHLSTIIPSDNCRRCHTPENRRFTTAGLIIPHRVHIAEKIDCAYCHNRVGHKAVKGYVNRTQEIWCIQCHEERDVKQASPEKCQACHRYRTKGIL